MFRSTETEFLLCYDGAYNYIHDVDAEGAKVKSSFRYLRRSVRTLLCVRREDRPADESRSHGEPNRDCQLIEWEGRPDSVAFHPPYLLLISAPFIEIRHIDNAKLLQIYTGSDIHLTWEYVILETARSDDS